jgi:hypothetical protein
LAAEHKSAYTDALRDAQLASERIGPKTLPYVAEELARKFMPRQQAPATSPKAWTPPPNFSVLTDLIEGKAKK